MSRFTTQGGGSGTPGPTGPQGPAGQDANTADFSFVESTMSTDGNMDIAVNGVPGEITLSAYAGVNINTNATHALNTTNVLPLLDNTYTLGDADHRWKSISIGEGTIYITDAATGNESALTISDGVFFIDGIAQAQLPNLTVTNLTFNDNTTQTTAAVEQVNSDWNATTGKAEILNKPDLSSVGVPETVSFTVSGGALGTQPTFNGAPLFTGQYIKTGDLVTVGIDVKMTNIIDFGSGQYYLDLPFFVKQDTTISGVLHDVSTNTYYLMTGIIEEQTNRALLYYTASNGTLVPFQQGSPRTLQTVDHFSLHGTYINDPS